MKLTVLLDLDGTLLINDMDAFIKAYLPLLSRSIPNIPAKTVIDQVLFATNRMITKKRPGSTLEETFDSNFYLPLGISKADLEYNVTHFYKEVFPKLRSLTNPHPAAVPLIRNIVNNGHQVVIATSPLFPRAATLHRLDWADLPLDKFNFNMVTTYESFHFAKPNPAYYFEILSQLGWPEQKVVMVGNSLFEDIIPAESLGIPTFWVNGEGLYEGLDMHPLSETGHLDEVGSWINKISNEAFDQNYSSWHAVVATIMSTPAAMETLYFSNPDRQQTITRHITSLLMDDFTNNFPALFSLLPKHLAVDYLKPVKLSGDQSTLQDFINIRSGIVEILGHLSDGLWGESSISRQLNDPPVGLDKLLYMIAENDRKVIRNLSLSLC